MGTQRQKNCREDATESDEAESSYSKSVNKCSMEERVMQKFQKIAGVWLVAGAVSLVPVMALHAQDATPKQDMKSAGTDTKDAAKDTGHAVSRTTSKGYHKTTHATKHAYHKTAAATDKSADKTKSGTTKAYDKTKTGTAKAYDKTKDATVKASKDTAHATENVGDKIAGKPAVH